MIQSDSFICNPIESNPITAEDAANDDSIIYIGPGVWKTDTIPLKDGDTVYIAGGALLYGQFNAYGLKDITIRGPWHYFTLFIRVLKQLKEPYQLNYNIQRISI